MIMIPWYLWVSIIKHHSFLTLVLDGGEWSVSYPYQFTPGEAAPSTHCIGGWMGLRAGIDIMEKRKISYPYQELNSYFSVIQPIA
jgi:hypothetical protein